jgi:hypothetical protein
MRSQKSCKKLEKVWYSNHTYLTIPPMDSPEILQFVDEAVYTNTGKHLNNLQRRIIAGILNRQRYADVAETYGYSSQHVKKASHELLQMLSEVFGEQVKKSNLESVLERHINQNITTLVIKIIKKLLVLAILTIALLPLLLPQIKVSRKIPTCSRKAKIKLRLKQLINYGSLA